MIEQYIDHLDNFIEYERTKERRRLTDEDFTPGDIINNVFLDEYPNEVWANKEIGFIDNNCGVGNILAEIAKRRLKAGLTLEETLLTLYSVEYESDNHKLCIDRLICGREDLRHIAERQIICADALRYHYRWDGSHPYDDEVKEQEFEDRFEGLFDKIG
tara:strand:- start:3083 stop:3559 length:477 start_codon:yes stop_codon:yes gene_type:complete